MRSFLPIVTLLLLAFSASAQELLVQTEPTVLYHQINESLSEDKPKQAIQHFKKVIEFYVQEKREQEIPENYFGMALAFAFSGHYKESIRYHKKAIRAHRKYRSKDEPVEMMINLGLTYELAGKNRKAKRLMSS